MPRKKKSRDIEKTYPRSQYIAKLRRLADALEKDEKFNLSSAGNTEPPAFELLKEMGFEVSKNEDNWTAENYNARFTAESPTELLGLVSLYQAKGERWQVSDEKIDEFVKFDRE